MTDRATLASRGLVLIAVLCLVVPTFLASATPPPIGSVSRITGTTLTSPAAAFNGLTIGNGSSGSGVSVVYDPHNYGAVCDGVANDTAAINAALAAIPKGGSFVGLNSGGILQFRAGDHCRYVGSWTIVNYTGLTIRGGGLQSTILNFTGSDGIVVPYTMLDFRLSDLKIINTQAGNTNTGVSVTNLERFHINNVWISGFGGYGLHVYGGLQGDISWNRITGGGGSLGSAPWAGIAFDRTPANDIGSTIRTFSNYVQASVYAGYYTNSTPSLLVSIADIMEFGEHCMVINNTVGFTIISPYCEAQTGTRMVNTQSDGLLLQGTWNEETGGRYPYLHETGLWNVTHIHGATDVDAQFMPIYSGNVTLGGASNRWGSLYADAVNLSAGAGNTPLWLERDVASSAGLFLPLRKSRGATILAPADAQNGDEIGTITWQPFSNGWPNSAQIVGTVSGSFTSGQTPPVQLDFKTATAGGSATTRASITPDGTVKVVNALQLGDLATGTCDSSNAGKIQYVAGGGGVADTIQACLKASGGTYSWKTMVTG